METLAWACFRLHLSGTMILCSGLSRTSNNIRYRDKVGREERGEGRRGRSMGSISHLV